MPRTTQTGNAKVEKHSKIGNTKQGVLTGGELCVQCGLCCNGAIFADVMLEAHEDSQALQRLGLRMGARGTEEIAARKFQQPCAVFSNHLCRVYEQRPSHCRKFACLLLKKVVDGRISFPRAEMIARETAELHSKALRILLLLGERNRTLPVRERYLRICAHFELRGLTPRRAALMSELSLVYHELTLRLSTHFYKE